VPPVQEEDVEAISLWTVPQLDPGSSEGRVFAEALQSFQDANPGLQLEVSLKPSRGPTGIRAFLDSTARVVPEQLPDVAVLPLDEISSAIASGLLRPLPASVPGDRLSDAFAFARDRCTDGAGTRWAVPLAVDVTHAVARATDVPVTWDAVLANGPYVVASGDGSVDGLATGLALYAASGGSLPDLPAADRDAVEEAFGFLAQGVADEVLVASPDIVTPTGSWNAFLIGEAAAAAVSGGVFASHQAQFPGLSWGPLPGPSGPAPPVGWGWAMAVTAPSAERAEAAGQLVAWLTAPERRNWVVPLQLFPAEQPDWAEAVAQQLDPSPAEEYLQFLLGRLQRARSVDGSADWGAEWGGAPRDVLGGGAVDSAANTVAP
jgi:ABC-type glycerol-3-phosphate transport system substrate-binding protein